jgi:heme exporter protein D
MGEFLAMGGYAQYVWTAFGVTFLIVIGNVVAARRRWRTTREQLSRRVERQAARAAARESREGARRSEGL